MKTIKVLLFLFIMTYAALGVVWALNIIPSEIAKSYFEKAAIVFGILFATGLAITFIFKPSSSDPSHENTSNGPRF